MKKPPILTSATEPRPEISQASDEKFRITYWLGLYEGHLFLNSPYSTYERYSRVLSRFYLHFPNKERTYDYLRPDFETYKNDRLKEGVSSTTINIELSVLRGFWRWMLRMEAPGVMINPVRGVLVKKQSKRKSLDERLGPTSE
jgi:site-specific recombinase XerD